jgi:alginate O-acetyltransferase complex protein AlgI
MIVSICTNLSLLGFFKYMAFFQGNANMFLIAIGVEPMPLYNVILPVGISFYTFQSMSYTIDIYRGDAKPARTFLDFACYVSMFPQLVAGPIVRYNTIDDQLRERTHSMERFTRGTARFMMGFSKKVLLANPCGAIADACFQSGDGSLNLLMAWIGIAAYAFQIYFDFSGYSDMAIGLGEMFGFKFPKNFDSPYRATSITDFWRRWHISLSTFLRDYLYIPLGGNRKGVRRTYINLALVMVIGGLWHGAQWTFVIWGAFHGIMLAFERWRGKSSPYEKLPEPVRIFLTFILVCIAWVFFRAENLEVSLHYFGAMFGLMDVGPQAEVLQASLLRPWTLFILAVSTVVVWAMPQTAQFVHRIPWYKAVVIVVLFAVAVVALSAQGFNPFLYFQF